MLSMLYSTTARTREFAKEWLEQRRVVFEVGLVIYVNKYIYLHIYLVRTEAGT